MSAENIYEIMEVSKQASKMVEDSSLYEKGIAVKPYYGFWEAWWFWV